MFRASNHLSLCLLHLFFFLFLIFKHWWSFSQQFCVTSVQVNVILANSWFLEVFHVVIQLDWLEYFGIGHYFWINISPIDKIAIFLIGLLPLILDLVGESTLLNSIDIIWTILCFLYPKCAIHEIVWRNILKRRKALIGNISNSFICFCLKIL